MPELQQYALLYERLSIITKRMETVVAHYGKDGTMTVERFEYIDLPRNEAAKQMIAQGWTDLGTGGPQSILLRKDS